MTGQPLTLADLAWLLVTAITVVGAVGGVWWRIHRRIEAEATAARQGREVIAARVEEIRAKSARELADFKLEVAKEYATNKAISQVEARVVEAIDRLGDRVDKFLEHAISHNQQPGRRKPGA